MNPQRPQFVWLHWKQVHELLHVFYNHPHMREAITIKSLFLNYLPLSALVWVLVFFFSYTD